MQYPFEVVQNLIDKHQVTVIIVPPITDTSYPTHEGAMHMEDWLAKLPTPYYTVSYNTLRADLESKDHTNICEGNHLYMWVNEDYSSDDS